MADSLEDGEGLSNEAQNCDLEADFPELSDFVANIDGEINDDHNLQHTTDSTPCLESIGTQNQSSGHLCQSLHQTPDFPSIALQPFPSPSAMSDGGECADYTSSERTSTDVGLTIHHDLFFRPTFLTIQVKYLLDHYSKNFLRIFSILDNKNTPWSSFHLPRALQCCSEPEVSGKSTPARSALLHAILSVSAYNLQCRHASQGQESAARKWAEVGLKYRMEALLFLKTSAGDPLVASTNAEYKELLAAMLSMVTVDVVSGDTRTCGLHLSGCESLIRARRRGGVKISSKTKALHRIFFYLRVMQDATEFTCSAFQPARTSTESHQSGPDDFETYLDPYEPLVDETFDSASYELIYGLPQSLLVLVHKTCSLLQKINTCNGAAFSPRMIPVCDQLEDDILEWPVEQEVARSERTRMDDRNCRILQHHIRAFHNATIIFFCRKIRFMNRKHLQQYVKAVICHLEEIKSIKGKEIINARPLLWPAFVAGEQAIDESTRGRFLKWFHIIEQHGVATAKLTRASLEEIWQRSSHNHLQAPIRVLHTQLMLT